MSKLDELTIGEVKQILASFGNSFEGRPQTQTSDDAHWQIGKVYLIRTVTMIQTGRLIQVADKELVLEDAAWIADTGRFSHALTSLEFGEVEPFPDGQVIIGRGAVIDAVIIKSTQRSVK